MFFGGVSLVFGAHKSSAPVCWMCSTWLRLGTGAAVWVPVPGLRAQRRLPLVQTGSRQGGHGQTGAPVWDQVQGDHRDQGKGELGSMCCTKLASFWGSHSHTFVCDACKMRPKTLITVFCCFVSYTVWQSLTSSTPKKRFVTLFHAFVKCGDADKMNYAE